MILFLFNLIFKNQHIVKFVHFLTFSFFFLLVYWSVINGNENRTRLSLLEVLYRS